MRSRGRRGGSTGVALAAGVFLVAMFVQSGCEPYGAVAAEGADTVSVRLPAHYGSGQADLLLYRITSRRTGERLGVGRSFHIEENRQVRAVLQMHDLEPGTELLVHLLWLNPDGKEMYTKEVHIHAEEWGDAARREELATELITLDPEARLLEVESRYGVGPNRFDEEFHKPEDKRDFKLGRWVVRAYLFRKLLLETNFELLPME